MQDGKYTYNNVCRDRAGAAFFWPFRAFEVDRALRSAVASRSEGCFIGILELQRFLKSGYCV